MAHQKKKQEKKFDKKYFLGGMRHFSNEKGLFFKLVRLLWQVEYYKIYTFGPTQIILYCVMFDIGAKNYI